MMIDITLCLSLNQRICAAGIMLDVKVERFYITRPYVISEPRDHETFAFAGKVAGLDRIEIV